MEGEKNVIVYPSYENVISVDVRGHLDQYKPHPMKLNKSKKRFEIPISELGVTNSASSTLQFYFSVTTKHETCSPHNKEIIIDGKQYNFDLLTTQAKMQANYRGFYRIRYTYRPTILSVALEGTGITSHHMLYHS